MWKLAAAERARKHRGPLVFDLETTPGGYCHRRNLRAIFKISSLVRFVASK